MGCAGKLRSPAAQQRLDGLDGVFGPQYFEQGRLVISVARDLNGVMKVAHKLQTRMQQQFGAMVEVIMEHMKYELWVQLHETTSSAGLRKGQEVPECQVTNIPEGIRVHPYKRDRMPTLEVLLLWEDGDRGTRGHILYTLTHPEVPTIAQADDIFAEIEPYFAKRWLIVELRMGPPVRGEFEEADDMGEGVCAPAIAEHDTSVGAGVEVVVLACHPYGSARERPEGTAATHVTNCKPIAFHGISDASGRAKLCFLPAETNKVQVAETARFHGTEVMLTGAGINGIGEGHTTVPVELTPKAVASVTVHVFRCPARLPDAEETDGIIDWASETRDSLPQATAEAAILPDGASSTDVAQPLRHTGGGVFVASAGLPEGCVSITASCPGYEPEERIVMLLVGENEFYLPLRRAHP